MSMLTDKERQHIVHIIPTLRFGGAEKIVIDVCNALVQDNQQATIITFCADVPQKERLDARVNHVVVEKKGKLSLGLVSGIRSVLKEIQPDIVHTHLFGADVWGRIAAKQLALPVITTEHNINVQENRVKDWIRFFLRNKSDRYIAVSYLVQEYLRKKCKVTKPIDVIYPGISLQEFSQVVPVQATIPISILMIGRLVQQKGFDIGLEALALVQGEWRCLIVGDGPEKQALQKRAVRLGIESRITFRPPTTNVATVFAQADIVLMPSRWEGFGMIAIEAMAAGRTVAATDTGALPELIDHGVSGVLVKTGDSKALAQAVQELIQTPTRIQDIGLQAKKVAAVCNMTDMYEKHRLLYKQV